MEFLIIVVVIAIVGGLVAGYLSSRHQYKKEQRAGRDQSPDNE